MGINQICTLPMHTPTQTLTTYSKVHSHVGDFTPPKLISSPKLPQLIIKMSKICINIEKLNRVDRAKDGS